MRFVAGILVLLALCGVCRSDDHASRDKHSFMRRAIVEHRAESVTVTANDPNPLWQAIFIIREEYGWVVDFEGAPVTRTADLEDNTNPAWRAAHPQARGYFIIRGGAFTSVFQDPTVIPGGEPAVLRKVVADYNATGYPGKYAVRKEDEGRYAVIAESVTNEKGEEQKVPSVLDTRISVPVANRSADQTIRLILEEVSLRSGVKVNCMSLPTNALQGKQVTVGGVEVSARDLLLQTFAAAERTMAWDLGFEPNDGEYYMNIYIAVKAKKDPTGNRLLFPIDRSR